MVLPITRDGQDIDGGGKTAATANLAYASAASGNRTVLCDLDPQGASGFPGLRYIPFAHEAESLPLSERTLKQLCGFCKANDAPRKKRVPVFSMVQKSKKLHHDLMKRMRDNHNLLLKNTIPFSSDI